VGDATGYASTGLRRLLVAFNPDTSALSLANLSVAQTQLSLRYSSTISMLGDEATVQDKFQCIVDGILADAELIARDPKGSSSGAGASSASGVVIKGADLVANVIRNPKYLQLEKAISSLDKGHGDYKIKALQLCLAAKIPFIFQVVAHRHQTTVANKHLAFLSEVQTCSASVGLAITRILYPDEPAAVFADASLDSKKVAAVLRGDPASSGLPSTITPGSSLFNLLLFPLEDIVNNKHRHGSYKYRVRSFSECYTLINLNLFSSKMALLFKALKVPAPSLSPATDLYVGYDVMAPNVQSLVFAMITRMMHAMELRFYGFFHSLANGDALHFEYPSTVELDEDAVALIKAENADAQQERRRYMRTFGYDPLDRGKRPRDEDPPGPSNPAPAKPGSRKDLIKKWDSDEFTFGYTTYPISDLAKLYEDTKSADAPPFKDMCLPVGCCFATGEASMMACQAFGTPGHENLTSKFHSFSADFKKGVKKLGKAPASPSGPKSPGRGRGRGRGRGKAPMAF
jgi:hypothetical protein